MNDFLNWFNPNNNSGLSYANPWTQQGLNFLAPQSAGISGMDANALQASGINPTSLQPQVTGIQNQNLQQDQAALASLGLSPTTFSGGSTGPDGITTQTFTPQTQQQQGGMQFNDYLNFGVDAAKAVGGIYYQNQLLDQNQQKLDLAQTAYNDSVQQREDLDAAYASWGK